MPARRSRRILRLRASIIGIEPEIWRTIDVDDSLSLAQLHMVLQVAFNWVGSHLHRFSEDDPWARSNGIPRIGRQPRAWVDAWSLAEIEIEGEEDEADTTIGEAMQHDGPLWYVYDSGDNWLHRIDLIDRDAAQPGEPLAQLISGERRAPFEDSGGGRRSLGTRGCRDRRHSRLTHRPVRFRPARAIQVESSPTPSAQRTAHARAAS